MLPFLSMFSPSDFRIFERVVTIDILQNLTQSCLLVLFAGEDQIAANLEVFDSLEIFQSPVRREVLDKFLSLVVVGVSAELERQTL